MYDWVSSVLNVQLSVFKNTFHLYTDASANVHLDDAILQIKAYRIIFRDDCYKICFHVNLSGLYS